MSVRLENSCLHEVTQNLPANQGMEDQAERFTETEDLSYLGSVGFVGVIAYVGMTRFGDFIGQKVHKFIAKEQ
jgi:hypothetical protein